LFAPAITLKKLERSFPVLIERGDLAIDDDVLGRQHFQAIGQLWIFELYSIL
jgi:hypothetical protein